MEKKWPEDTMGVGRHHNWRVMRFGQVCEFCVPPDAICRVQEDEATMEIQLATEPRTSIYVGFYDVPEEKRASTDAWLSERMEYFFGTCVSPIVERRGAGELNVSVEQWTDEETSYSICQGVGLEVSGGEDTRCWYARVVGVSRAREYFLMDWTGPRSYATGLVLPIYLSFRGLVWGEGKP